MLLLYFSMIDDPIERSKFERIYLSYRQTMYYTANRILKNPQDAEDAVHQAFLRVLDNLDNIDEEDSRKTRSFLVIITEHIAIDLYRKKKREDVLSYDSLSLYIKDTTAPKEEKIDELTEALRTLPIHYSIMIRLKYALGYENVEIAQILGLTEENVRQRLSRAKKKLAEIMGEGTK